VESVYVAASGLRFVAPEADPVLGTVTVSKACDLYNLGLLCLWVGAHLSNFFISRVWTKYCNCSYFYLILVLRGEWQKIDIQEVYTYTRGGTGISGFCVRASPINIG